MSKFSLFAFLFLSIGSGFAADQIGIDEAIVRQTNIDNYSASVQASIVDREDGLNLLQKDKRFIKKKTTKPNVTDGESNEIGTSIELFF